MSAVMKMFVSLTIVALAVVSVASSDPFTVIKDPGNFTINQVTMTTPSGVWQNGDVATVTFTGTTLKKILAGVVKWYVHHACF